LIQNADLSAWISSRRCVVRAALAGAAWALIATIARAGGKMSQVEAQYRDRPKNGLSCAACSLFRPPAACAVVVGVISPHGWCQFFDLPD
jgi:hypothetical protein